MSRRSYQLPTTDDDSMQGDRPFIDVSGNPAAQSMAAWGRSNPGQALAFSIAFYLGAGVLAIWWTLAQLLAHPSVVWLESAIAGGLLAAFISAHWAYVGLVKSYEVGRFAKALVYTYTYGIALGGAFVIIAHDSVSAGVIFVSSCLGVFFILATPLVFIGYSRYRKDPERAARIMARAKWMKGLRIRV